MRGGGGGDRDQPAGPIVVDDDPKGTLRLEGQVVDEADRPVGGATVVLSSNPPRSATTEADGGFAFDALVGRPYTLVARAAQGVAGPVTARLTAKSDPVVLHLRPGAKISVTVTSSKGEPLDGATVELRGTDVQRATTKDGEVTFAPVVPGGYQVAAWAEGLARASEYTQARKGEVKVKLVLFAGAPVSGRVVDSDGKGVSTARVSYRAASSLGGRGDARYDSVATGPDGSFRFDALPAGSFRFTAAHPQYAPGSSALVTLDGKASKDGVLITLDAGATVRGHVYDAEHKPIASASVRIGVAQGGRRGGGGGFEPPRQAFSDDQGAFEIHGLPKRELEAVATHESGASHGKAIDASGGDVSDVELVIDVVGTISGVVVDPDGNAIEGAQVTAFPSMRGGDFAELRLRGPAQELTDGAGRFTLTGLSPGSYTLDASRSRTGGFGGFGGRGRRGASDGVTAETGAKDVKLVLQPEGGVKGKVVMTDGSVPTAFTVQIGATQQAFSGDSAFELDGIAPAQYGLSVRGPMFLAHSQDVLIEPGKIVDVGTIQVEQGRALAGIVVAGGQPVPNATVYAGRQVLGDGSTSSVQLGALNQNTHQTTTASDGTFSIGGLGDGDLTIVAEQPEIGRSKSLRVTPDMQNQSELVLELQGFGSLSGTVRQNGTAMPNVRVSCQSTTTPGSIYMVISGPDGTYRYDRLAPDTYKVSATIGSLRTGMQFYSQQVSVPIGQAVQLDLQVTPGDITLDVAAVPGSGTLTLAGAWLANGVITAKTGSDLSLALAGAGAGSSQFATVRGSAPAAFAQLAPAQYSACVVPLPTQVTGLNALGYIDRHGDKLPAYCMPVTVQPSPETQSVSIPVQIPPYIGDGSGSGSGSGS